MTRPMPGPPEDWWYCTPPHGQPGLWTSDMDPAEYMPFTHLQHKRLTDAECAAERGEARADWMHMKFLIASRQVVSMRARPNAPMPEPSPPLERKLDEARGRFYTWRRFARTPHLDADAT